MLVVGVLIIASFYGMTVDGTYNDPIHCESGSLNLTDVSGGVLQVCNDNEWLAVCGLYFQHASAAVSCRQMGYDSGFAKTRSYTSGDETDSVRYYCTGQESSLADCEHEESSCSYGIRIACVYKNESDPCSSGEMRLRGGATENEGRVELCTQSGVWSAVSYWNWGQADAVVACRQLGSPIALPTRDYRSTTDQPVEFGGYGCRGTESSLSECTVYSSYIKYIRVHHGYAELKCISNGSLCTEGDVRLVNGYSENNGIVEICIDGVWIGACVDNSYRPIIATAVCKQLGYARGTKIENDFFMMNQEALAYVRLYYYYCSGPTYSPISCVYGGSNVGFVFYESCHSDVFSVLCCGNDNRECFASTTQVVQEPVPDPPNTDEPTPIPNSEYYQLHFGDSRAQLFTDLRGLEKDIHTRIVSDVSTNCNCNFNSASLGEGNFLFGEGLTYRGVLFEVDGHSASSLVEMLSKSIHKQPRIKYQHGDIYFGLSISANCSVSIESLDDPEC